MILLYEAVYGFIRPAVAPRIVLEHNERFCVLDREHVHTCARVHVCFFCSWRRATPLIKVMVLAGRERAAGREGEDGERERKPQTVF